MRWRPVVAGLTLLLTGCDVDDPDPCPVPSVDPKGSLLRLDPTTGTERSVVPVPWSGEVRTVAGEVSVVLSSTPTPVARADRVVPSPRTTSTVAELVGPGDWRLRGAGGTEVGVVRDRVVVLGDDLQLRGLRLSDGRPEWNAYLDHHLSATDAQLVGNVVYVSGTTFHELGDRATSELTLAALDATTGRALWRWSRPRQSSPVGVAVFDDVVVTAASASPELGFVGAVDRRTGQFRWETTTNREYVGVVARSGEDLVLVTMDFVPGCL
jgi:outer membrane protein assembly factor BamB